MPQLTAAVKELQEKGYAIPDYPAQPKTDEEKKLKERYGKVLGSAVNDFIKQHIHVEPGRVGELNQENAVAGNRAQRLEVGLARIGVEGVEHQPDRLMIGAPHHFPGVAIIVDVAAPGQRLEPDPHAAFGRALAEFAEIRGGAVDAAQRFRRDIAADHQQIAAELLHQVELALGAIEGAAPLRLRHALEIAERLKRDRP